MDIYHEAHGMTDHDKFEEFLRHFIADDPRELRAYVIRTSVAAVMAALALVALFLLNPPPFLWFVGRALVAAVFIVACVGLLLAAYRQRKLEHYARRHQRK